MKMKWMMLSATMIGVGLMLGTGCDWSSGGSSSLNTSQGAGININFSGVYNGNIDGRAVDRTTAGTISYLTIRQTGNQLEVVDSQGSHYEGSVGSPGLVSTAGSDGTFPPGAELVQAQISWAGKDEVAQREVEFVGIIHAVSVEDIEGTTETHTSTDNSSSSSDSSSSSSQNLTSSQTYSSNNGSNTTITTINTYGTLGTPFYEQDVITVVVDNSTGQEISRNVTKTGDSSQSSNSSSADQVVVETIDSYVLSEANIQYRLEGTWIEKDSPIVSKVDAISRGAYGVITISTVGSQELILVDTASGNAPEADATTSP